MLFDYIGLLGFLKNPEKTGIKTSWHRNLYQIYKSDSFLNKIENLKPETKKYHENDFTFYLPVGIEFEHYSSETFVC
jgi:hypothetical protein